jgi:Tfp pilus assembly protein PilF
LGVNAYASLKNAQNTIDDYSKAIQIPPKFIQAYEQRAEIYESIGDNESAKRDKDRAKNIKPELN